MIAYADAPRVVCASGGSEASPVSPRHLGVRLPDDVPGCARRILRRVFSRTVVPAKTFSRTVVPHALFCVTFRTVVPQLQNGGTAQLLTIQNGGTALNFCPEWYIIRKRRTRDVFRTVVPHRTFLASFSERRYRCSFLFQNSGTAPLFRFRTVVGIPTAKTVTRFFAVPLF